MVAGPVRVVVLADLHATSLPPGDEADSWLSTKAPRTPTTHPLIGLEAYFNDFPQHVDLLLVAGDICDKADSKALTETWSDLTHLAGTLGAKMIATAGNHDLDSRHLGPDMDPRGTLYDLDPPFPTGCEAERDRFWARNYVVVDGPTGADGRPEWRVVTLNSAAFHGYSGRDGDELNYGRVSVRTVQRLRAEISELPESKLNILMLHHHIAPMPLPGETDKSQMIDAEHLTEFLEETGSWIVFHGHTHQAKIMFGGAGAYNTVFSAGSMSAFPHKTLAGSGTANQPT
ncbi:metallophosphoesterase family protein [Gordonia lacunae]|uniref:metallophosphoesterase family protein n=1 Tax=Gordonia lacunae TaxID=417102 RepID=UPI0039E26695